MGGGACPNLTTGIPQQCISCRFEVLVNFGKVFALFLGAFIVDFEYSFFILNVRKCYLVAYLCGTPNRRYIRGSCCQTLVCYKTLLLVLHRYLSISCYDDVIFNFYFFIVIGKTCSMSLIRFNNHFFAYCFI